MAQSLVWGSAGDRSSFLETRGHFYEALVCLDSMLVEGTSRIQFLSDFL